jgi:hypothetical protein
MKYVAEIGSDTVTYVPSFIKTGSGFEKIIRWGTKARREEDRVSLP